MKFGRPFLASLFVLFLCVEVSCQADQFKSLRETQLKEFFKWIKMDKDGMHFEEKLNRGFTMKNDAALTRRGNVFTLPFGATLEMAWERGSLKLTPKEDVTGAFFEAATSTGGNYYLRMVTASNGPRLEIEEE